MNVKERVDNYNKQSGFPESLFIAGDGRIVGTWVMGNNYQVKSEYYGGYPHGYLKRISLLFPDRRDVLHLFSGKVDTDIIAGKTVDLNPDNGADYVTDAHNLSEIITEKFDLILADPPYSVEDCEHYGTVMIKRNVVLKESSKLLKTGGFIVWLDQVLPMYKKTELRTVGYIGMVKSTNHRFRVITIFQKV
jgi:hypothetical protein